MDTRHVFISYRSLESNFALRLAADLKRAGIHVWMDRLDGIQVGMDWRSAIADAVNHCAGLVAIVSPEYVVSEYCLKELSRANDLKRPIYPVLLDKVNPEAMPLVLDGLQWLDFTTIEDTPSSYFENIDKLIARLKAELPAQVGAAPNEEQQYLIDLIADLEARRGVQEYIELHGHTKETRPQPLVMDEWGYTHLIKSKEQHEDVVREISLESIQQAVAAHNRFVLVGKPGSGKTTTIRRLARLVAQSRMDKPRNAPLPFLVYLSQWESGEDFDGFLNRQWPFASDLNSLLTQGDIWLYLDGLNEMGEDTVEKIKVLRDWLHDGNGPQHVIVTCRRDDYNDQLNLPIVLIRELEPTQVREFAENYLENEAEIFLEKVRPEDDGSQLAQLARNPYLLGALIFLFQTSETQTLPQNNGDLSRRLAEALWEREKQRKTRGWVPYDTMVNALSRLAFDMIDEGKATDVRVDYAAQKLTPGGWLRFGKKRKADALLHVMQRANLLEQRAGYVRFYHQLLQEYFAAEKLLGTGIEGYVQQLQTTGVSGFRPAQKWDQVVIAACGIAEDEALDRLLCEIAERDPCLAADCVCSGIVIADGTRASVHTQVARCIGDRTEWRTRKVAVSAADKLGDLALLHQAARDFDSNVRLDALQRIEQYRDKSSIPVLVENLSFRDAAAVARAIAILSAYGIEIIDELLSMARDTEGDTRQAFVRVLAGMDEIETVFAQELAQPEADPIWTAVKQYRVAPPESICIVFTR
jgi:energy-coupling factor transporter ATP-binding protein EcfA2